MGRQIWGDVWLCLFQHTKVDAKRSGLRAFKLNGKAEDQRRRPWSEVEVFEGSRERKGQGPMRAVALSMGHGRWNWIRKVRHAFQKGEMTGVV